MIDEYLNTDEVAAICRTSPSTVRFWRYAGKGPHSMKVGRRVLYARQDVEDWLKALSTAVSVEPWPRAEGERRRRGPGD